MKIFKKEISLFKLILALRKKRVLKKIEYRLAKIDSHKEGITLAEYHIDGAKICIKALESEISELRKEEDLIDKLR